MDSTVGESIESSAKPIQSCEASSMAEKTSVPVDGEPEDVDIATTNILAANDEQESVQVNGLSHNSTTNNADETNSIASIDTPDTANATEIESHSLEPVEESSNGIASDTDKNAIEEEVVRSDADHVNTEHVDAIHQDADHVNETHADEDYLESCSREVDHLDEMHVDETRLDADQVEINQIEASGEQLDGPANVETIPESDGQHEETEEIADDIAPMDIVNKDSVDDDVVDREAISEDVVNMFLDEIIDSAATSAIAAEQQEQAIEENSNQSIASDSTEFDGLVINEASVDSSETACNSKMGESVNKTCTNANATTTAEREMESESVFADAQQLAADANELINTDVINANEDETATKSFHASDEVSVQQTSRDETLDLLNGDSNCSSSSSNSSTSTSSSNSTSSSSSSSSSSNSLHNSPKQTLQVDEITHAIHSRPAKRKLSTDSMDDSDVHEKRAKVVESENSNRYDGDGNVTTQTNGNDDDVIEDSRPESTALVISDTTAEDHNDTNSKFILDNHFVASPIMEQSPLESLESDVNIHEAGGEIVDASTVTKDDGCADAKHVNGFIDDSPTEKTQPSAVPQSYNLSTIIEKPPNPFETIPYQQNSGDLKIHYLQSYATKMFGPSQNTSESDPNCDKHKHFLQTYADRVNDTQIHEEQKQHLKQQSAFSMFNHGVVSNHARCLALQPMVKFKCFKCEANDFRTLAELKIHHLMCLRNNNLDKSMENNTINGKMNVKQQRISDAVATVVGANVPTESTDTSFFSCVRLSEPTNASAQLQLAATEPTLSTPIPHGRSDSSRTISSIDTKQSSVNPPNAQIRIRRQVFLCSACGTYFEKWNLFYHIREVHKKFICLFCLGIFPSAERLVNHLESKHIAKPNVFEHKDELMKSLRDQCYLMCCVCEYIFSEADDFTGHSCENYMKPCFMCGLKFIHKTNCKLGTTKASAATVTTGGKQKAQKSSAATTEANKRTATMTAPLTWSSQNGPPMYQNPALEQNASMMLALSDILNMPTENNENRPIDDDGTKPNSVNRTVKPLRLSLVDHKNSVATKKNATSHVITPTHPGKNMNNMLVSQEATSEQCYRAANGNDDSDQADDDEDEDQGKQRLLIPHYVRDDSVQQIEAEKEQTPLLVPKLKLKISREFQTSIESEESSTESDDGDDDDNDNEDSSVAEENTSTSLVETNSFADNSTTENFHHMEEAAPPLEESTEIQQSMELEPVAPHAASEFEQAPTIDETINSGGMVFDLPATDSTMDTDFTQTAEPTDNETVMASPPTLPTSNVADEPTETPNETQLVSEENRELTQTDEIVVDDVSTEPAIDTRPITEFILDQPLDKIPIKEFVRKCLESTFAQCLYCNHARQIAVNGRILATHLMEMHRFSATVDSITAEELLPDTIELKISSGLADLEGSYFNMSSYDYGTSNDDYVFVKSFECFQCRFHSPIYKDLYLHNRKMHLRAALICHMCHCNFFSYSELVCHMCPGAPTLMIPIDIKFRCVLCTLDDIPSAFRLMVHLRKKHSACDVCLEECFDQSRLSCHVWKHKLHHLCYRCNITYRNKADITRHLFWKHGTESVLCKRCLEKKWPHVYHFCVPPPAFPCEVCGSKFGKAVALKVHKRLHTEDSVSYACTETEIECGKKFISRKLLEKHVSRHYMPSLPPWPLPPYVPDKEENDYGDEDEEVKCDVLQICAPHTPPYEPTITLDEEVNAEAQDDAMPLEKPVSPSKADADPSAETANAEITNVAALEKNDSTAVAEQKGKKKFRKNKSDLSDILDLPTLNLSESDSSDDSDNESSLPPNAAASAENSMHSFGAAPSQTSENDRIEITATIDDEDEAKAIAPIVDIWDNFKSYQASQMQDKAHDDSDDDKMYAEQPAILHVSQSDHDYCMMYKPIAKKLVVTSETQEPATVTPLIETNGKGEIHVSFIDIPVAAEPAMASPNNHTVDVVDNVENVGEIDIEEKTATDVVVGENVKIKTPSKKTPQRKRSVSDSSSGDSSDSSSSCSCGSNCSCSSSSSSGSSSSSDSDSDSSSSEGRRRKKLKSQKSPAKAEATAASAVVDATEVTHDGKSSPSLTARRRSQSPKIGTNEESTRIKDEQQMNEETLVTPKQESTDGLKIDGDLVDVITTDVKLPPAPDPDTIIVESDLETTESETDEDFYDEHPQKLANQLLAEKRKQLMLQTYAMSDLEAAAIAANSRSTTPLMPEERDQKVKIRKRKRDRKSAKGNQPSPRKCAAAKPAAQVATLPPPNVSIASHHMASPTPIKSQPQPNLAQMNTTNSLVAAIGQPPTTPNNIRLSTSSCSDADSSLKRSKRRRIPNKFYGYTSDDDNITMSLPKPPPVLVWNKEDLPSKPSKLSKVPKPSKKLQRQSLPLPPPPPSLKTIIRFGSDGLASRAIVGKTAKNHRKLSLTPNARKRMPKPMANKAKMALASIDTPPTVPKLIIRPFGIASKSTKSIPKPTPFEHQQQSLPPPHALNELLRVPAVPTHHIAAQHIPMEANQSSDESDSDSDSSSDAHMRIVQPTAIQPTIIKKSNKNSQWTTQNHQQNLPPAANVPMPFQQIRQHLLPNDHYQQSPAQGDIPMFNNQPLDPFLINKPNQIRYPIRPPIGCRSQAREGESVYCYCRCPYDEVSEMIACDATNCPIEWFHFECVGIVVAPQDKWYCPQCRPKHNNTNHFITSGPPQSSSVINHFVDANQLQQTTFDRLAATMQQDTPFPPASIT